MPRAIKSTYTSKQKRQARRIAASAKGVGYSGERAQMGYATVNEQEPGGKKIGSKKSRRVRGKKSTRPSSRAVGRARRRSGGKKSTRLSSRAVGRARRRARRAACRS